MFPLWYLLIPYGIFLCIATLFVFFNLYHIAAFGLQSLKTTIVFITYLFSFVAIVWVSFHLLQNVDWHETVDLRTLIQAPTVLRRSSPNDL